MGYKFRIFDSSTRRLEYKPTKEFELPIQPTQGTKIKITFTSEMNPTKDSTQEFIVEEVEINGTKEEPIVILYVSMNCVHVKKQPWKILDQTIHSRLWDRIKIQFGDFSGETFSEKAHKIKKFWEQRALKIQPITDRGKTIGWFVLVKHLETKEEFDDKNIFEHIFEGMVINIRPHIKELRGKCISVVTDQYQNVKDALHHVDECIIQSTVDRIR